MVDEETENRRAEVLAQLKEGSEYLENQTEALSRLWEGFRGKVVTFYETEPTKSVKKVRRYHTDRTELPQSVLREPCVLFSLYVKTGRIQD